jgi:hypothetical protein
MPGRRARSSAATGVTAWAEPGTPRPAQRSRIHGHRAYPEEYGSNQEQPHRNALDDAGGAVCGWLIGG